MAPFRSRRARSYGASPLVAFLLVASFGILFVGCGPATSDEDEVTFTETDLEEFHDIASKDGSGSIVATDSGSGLPYLVPLASGSGSSAEDIVLDLSNVPRYNAIRSASDTERNRYRVAIEFVNVRAGANSQSAFVAKLDRGESVEVTSFPDASWAQVKLSDGRTGYVALRYLARVTSDTRLAEEKKQFEGQYYVNFAFVNVRQSPDQSSPKIGEIPGQAIVRPTSIQGGWAAVTVDGKPGYVSDTYLEPFLPAFQVRQESFELPILHYRLENDVEALLKALPTHVKALKDKGYSFMTLKQFADVLEQQESRDVRLNPKSVVVAISGITSETLVKTIAALDAAGIRATLFIETSSIGMTGITEKQLLTLRANGQDVQSAGHTGDDFRMLTNAQATLELQQSRKLLEERGAGTVSAVAYPQGGVNDRIAMLTKEAGYLLGLSEGSSRTFDRGDLLRLPGIVVFPMMTTEDVVKLATGQ